MFLYARGSEGGVPTLTRRSYIGKRSAKTMDDGDNVRMLGLTIPKKLRDFGRQSQSFFSRFQELIDREIGVRRRTMLNTTVNGATRKSWATESTRISGMISRTSFNLDVKRCINCEMSSTQRKQ